MKRESLVPAVGYVRALDNLHSGPWVEPVGSSKKPMQEPTQIAGIGVAAIAAAEQPEAAATPIFNAVVVAHRMSRVILVPPLRRDPLRPVGATDTVMDVPPGEGDRRIIRQQRDCIHWLRRIE